MSRCRLCGGPSDHCAEYDPKALGGYWASLTVPVPSIEIRRCRRFGSYFTSVVPAAEMIRGQYLVDWNEYYGDALRSAERKAQRCLSQLARFVPPNSRVLDVGGGDGAFVLAAASNYRCWLQELNGTDSERLERAGVTTVSSIDEAPTGSFDAITLWDVYEHVWPHAEFLALIRRALAPGGQLLMEVPSPTRLSRPLIWLGSFSRTPRRERTFAQVCDFSHLQLMTARELAHEVQTLGFDVLHVESMSELSYAGQVYAERLIGPRSLAKLIGRAFDQRAIRRTVLGNNKVFVLARPA
jgi:cyclopropane fatty-acyl-phospholipid synthase-like methyltransferase